MNIRFSGKKLTVTAGIRDHFKEKLIKLEKYEPKIIASHVVLKKEKYGYEAEITLHSKHFQAFGEGRDKQNIYTAIDTAYHRVARQLKKHHDKVTAHHRGHGTEKLGVKMERAERMDPDPAVDLEDNAK